MIWLALQAWHTNLLGILVVVVVLTVRNMWAVTLRRAPGSSEAVQEWRCVETEKFAKVVCAFIVFIILPRFFLQKAEGASQCIIIIC